MFSLAAAATFLLSSNSPAFARGMNDSATAINQPYLATYEVSRRGREHGSAFRRLENTESGYFKYHTETDVSFFFLRDTRVQITEFEFSNGFIQPLSYEYIRTGTGSNERREYLFESERELESAQSENVVANHPELLDANSVLHQLQLGLSQGETHFEFEVIDEKGKRETYVFRVMQEETINVPHGVLDTIRVERVRESQRRETYFWFSPLLNYTLVQMQQLKEGKEQAKLSLKTIELSHLQQR